MGRKILNNYRKSQRVTGSKYNRIHSPLGIQDKHGNWITVGDKVNYVGYIGHVLYNTEYDTYDVMLDSSMCNDNNPYDPNSYSKSIPIPMDNGAKMHIEIINST